MTSYRSARQLNLFGEAVNLPSLEAPPADFVQRIRDELIATLVRVREAATLPWKDLTQATLAELRFDSIADWLPESEAAALRSEFHRELDRLYALLPLSETD